VTVTIPAFILVGAIAYVAWRFTGLRIWQAALCILFGFLLAFTNAAPGINNVLAGLTHWLARL
jgi:hypothetical protein